VQGNEGPPAKMLHVQRFAVLAAGGCGWAAPITADRWRALARLLHCLAASARQPGPPARPLGAALQVSVLPEAEGWGGVTFHQDIAQASDPINQADFVAMEEPEQTLLHPSECPGRCSSRGICVARREEGEDGQVTEQRVCLCAQVGSSSWLRPCARQQAEQCSSRHPMPQPHRLPRAAGIPRRGLREAG
jgi:hypothetical protein